MSTEVTEVAGTGSHGVALRGMLKALGFIQRDEMFEGLQLTFKRHFKRIIPNGFMLFLIAPLKAFNEPPCTNMFVFSTRRECRVD